MQASDRELMSLWEKGYSARPYQRALLLLSLATDQTVLEELIDVPVGLRDGWLMKLRQRLFGDQIVATTICTHCGFQLELNFSIEPLIQLMQYYSKSILDLTVKDRNLRIRRPSTRDLLEISHCHPNERHYSFVKRCVVNFNEWASDSFDDELGQLVTEQLALQDPLADVEYSSVCVECNRELSTPFDIVQFLWAELNGWCQRLVSDIHTLARYYGWREVDILEMGAWRRQVYLNMIRQ